MRPIIKSGLKPLIRSTTTLRSLSFFQYLVHYKKVHFQNMSQNQSEVPMRTLLTLFTLFILITLMHCSPTESEFKNHSFSLEVDAEVLESWITLQVDGAKPHALYTLLRGDSILFKGKIAGTEKLIHDTGLEPATQYSYHFFAESDGEKSRAKTATRQTMDTTDYKFDWRAFAWGDYNNSTLNDVIILAEDNIWAIGEIYTEDVGTIDSAGNAILPYNAVHWDGKKWEVVHLLFPLCQPNIPWPLVGTTVYAFTKDSVFFTNGATHLKWEGDNKEFDCSSTNISNYRWFGIWGRNMNDFFGVGSSGTMVRYKNGKWKKVETGTQTHINDIWGVERKGIEPFILAGVSDKYSPGDKKLFQVHDDNSLTELEWPYEHKTIHSIWFETPHTIFICGAGVRKRNRVGDWHDYTTLPRYYTNHIRGQALNDIFTVGDHSLIAHFNGKSWQTIDGVVAQSIKSFDYKNDLMVGVGFHNRQAYLIMVRRK